MYMYYSWNVYKCTYWKMGNNHTWLLVKKVMEKYILTDLWYNCLLWCCLTWFHPSTEGLWCSLIIYWFCQCLDKHLHLLPVLSLGFMIFGNWTGNLFCTTFPKQQNNLTNFIINSGVLVKVSLFEMLTPRAPDLTLSWGFTFCTTNNTF